MTLSPCSTAEASVNSTDVPLTDTLLTVRRTLSTWTLNALPAGLEFESSGSLYVSVSFSFVPSNEALWNTGSVVSPVLFVTSWSMAAASFRK